MLQTERRERKKNLYSHNASNIKLLLKKEERITEPRVVQASKYGTPCEVSVGPNILYLGLRFMFL